MNTNLPSAKLTATLILVCLLSSVGVKSQTYTTIANGAWSSASTWQGGNIPVASNIPLTAVINIEHIVTYSGSNIVNNGTINIYNPSGITPQLYVASGVNFTNNLTGRINITQGEYQQYRFAGGGQSGTSQNGSFTNAGGYVQINSSYVEIAQSWTNNGGTVVFKNSSLVIGQSYQTSGLAVDTLSYTSLSIGWQGSGNFQEGGLSVYFLAFRAELAGTSGNFTINNIIANGEIDYITLKNDFTGVSGNGNITFSGGLLGTGLSLQAYCIANSSNFKSNGKLGGPQTQSCALNDFPATLLGANAPKRMNFSANPLLISGTDLQAGAKYIYKGVAPGVDAVITIDSIIGGAVINTIDDNTGANGGYPEAFQPIITSGPSVGKSYAVFAFNYNITGTTVPYKLDTFNLTALDIDGQSGLEEFDQIAAGVGASASYVTSNPKISLSQVSPGTFLGIDADQASQPGVDTSSKVNMYTVTNTGVSSFTATLGIKTTQAQQTQRLFSLYTQGFNYPTAPVSLPVTLESFTATLGGNHKVNLNWVTVDEINFSHFVVERSTDGTDFNDVETVFTDENTTQKTNYNMVDNISSLQANLIYYRLRMVNMDGTARYSDIQMVNLFEQQQNTLTIVTYPNPVTSEIHITLPNNWQNKHVTFEFFSTIGQLSKIAENENSGQTETINVSNLPHGIYMVRVSCNGQNLVQKIVKN
ncbi:MAG TPA: T9SS type A sorting domain-containing protein [Puia sp.]|nr:T9SS type A sorting domain-containing protein [Puia sp.]